MHALQGRAFFVAKTMVSNELLAELTIILQEEFKLTLEKQDLSEFGNMLVQLFETLQIGEKNYLANKEANVKL